jgi:hypothetical protein
MFLPQGFFLLLNSDNHSRYKSLGYNPGARKDFQLLGNSTNRLHLTSEYFRYEAALSKSIRVRVQENRQ